jgi:hypothetical protein
MRFGPACAGLDWAKMFGFDGESVQLNALSPEPTHMEFATTSGCREVQGFHLCRPVPETELAEMYHSVGPAMKAYDVKAWQDEVRPSVRWA